MLQFCKCLFVCLFVCLFQNSQSWSVPQWNIDLKYVASVHCMCSSWLIEQVYLNHFITRPAMIHWYTSTSRYFLPRYEYCILNKLLRYLRYIYICINKHGKALSSISAHPPSASARRFSKQTDEKNPCWAVFSITFKMADTNACVLPMSAAQTLSPKARHEAIPFLFCCYVTYCIVYRIVTTVLGYI